MTGRRLRSLAVCAVALCALALLITTVGQLLTGR